MKFTNKLFPLMLWVAVSACSQEAAVQPAPQSASEIKPLAASQATWTPPPKAETPAAQAQQLRDLMAQFQNEAAERMVQQRQKNMQPSQAESVDLVRREAAAIRQDAQRLQQLDLSDTEVNTARDLLAKNMLAFAQTADLQVQSAELLAQNKQAEAEAVNKQLGELMNGIQAGQQQADEAFNALLKKHKIER